MTQDRLIVGVKGGGSKVRAKARALPDLCWLSAHLVQCEPDEPAAAHGLNISRESSMDAQL